MTQETNERTWTEAPASVNVKFSFEGYDTMLTLRGESGGDVLPKLREAIGWLRGHGAQPTAGTNGNGAGHGPTVDEGPHVCPIHNVPMKRREKHGDVWYSHKAIGPNGAEFWCRGGED
jgi:hypothetical protein